MTALQSSILSANKPLQVRQIQNSTYIHDYVGSVTVECVQIDDDKYLVTIIRGVLRHKRQRLTAAEITLLLHILFPTDAWEGDK